MFITTKIQEYDETYINKATKTFFQQLCYTSIQMTCVFNGYLSPNQHYSNLHILFTSKMNKIHYILIFSTSKHYQSEINCKKSRESITH